MARPSNAARKFAELYVNGPAHIVGQWEMCANAAGMKEIPSRDDTMIRRLVEELGGVVAPIDAEPEIAIDLEALAAAAADGTIPWSEMAKQLTIVMSTIASGKVKASAAQVSIIKHIIAEAKATSATDDTVNNVILLPVQGGGATATLDPVWQARIDAAKEPVSE